jgi:hypothetical protein
MNLCTSWPYFSDHFQDTRLPTYDAKATRTMPDRSNASLRCHGLNLRLFLRWTVTCVGRGAELIDQ